MLFLKLCCYSSLLSFLLLISSPTDLSSFFPFFFLCFLPFLTAVQPVVFLPVSSENIWTQDGLKSFVGKCEPTELLGNPTVKALILVNKKYCSLPCGRRGGS